MSTVVGRHRADRLPVSNSTPMPRAYRAAEAEADLVALQAGDAVGDARLPALLNAAREIMGLALAGLVEKGDAADRLQLAATRCGAIHDYGSDAVQSVFAQAEGNVRAEHSRKQLAEYVETRCVIDVIATPVVWLWRKRFACGKFNIIAGRPGLGKSQLALAMVATVTVGGTWPDGTRALRGSAIIIGCEDDVADTMRPRLEVLGADLRRVHVVDWIVDDGKRCHFDVGAHCERLRRVIDEIGDVRVILIDPITAYLGGTDTHKTADVRQALAPLQQLAAETGAAVVAISHLNKSGDGSAINRVTGSGAFVAVARSAWLVAQDPADESGYRRILTPLKTISAKTELASRSMSRAPRCRTASRPAASHSSWAPSKSPPTICCSARARPRKIAARLVRPRISCASSSLMGRRRQGPS